MKRLLIANRGEIALRILRTVRELGIETVSVYSEVDANAPWVQAADHAVLIGPPAPQESYLQIERILDAARQSGADAIHPGYGFLSENAAFAQACRDAGLTFVGPPPRAIAAMGDKMAARSLARSAGVPVVPGVESDDLAEIAGVGFPLLLKAAGGGGGRGMRIVEDPDRLPEVLAEAQAEAERAFGDRRVYAERYLPVARHIEVQVLSDRFGNHRHLGERECSLQRRHQKLIEECPSPAVTPSLRTALTTAALKLCAAVRYEGAGTVEFLLSPDGSFYFLEMNTRIQVEHPVTELVYGVDIVREQLRIADGQPIRGSTPLPRGHAIECRIVAEDGRFFPSPGRITRLRVPHGPGLRWDGGPTEGDTISLHYDALIGKLIAWGPDRESARARMIQALREMVVMGVASTAELLRDVLEHPDFTAAQFHTRYLEGFATTRVEDSIDPALFIAAWATRAPPTATATAAPDRIAGPWSSLGSWRNA